MALPYKRNFNIGRGSEQLYNDESHKVFESVKHLTDSPGTNKEPVAKAPRSIWHDEPHNALKWWDPVTKTWRKYFESEFRITSEILSILPPDGPVRGQLWIHNGVLCYYDGSNWQPIKALLQDGSQFSLDVFRNFILISPLWKIGNTVVPDADIEAFKKLRREYLQGVINYEDDAMVEGDGTKWDFDHECDIDEATLPVLDQEATAQLLVPQIDYDRIFLNHDLDTSKYQEVSKVCISYKKKDIADSVVSLVHINPGRITGITKRLFKIDRNNPRVQVQPGNTEFYGFHKGNPYGELLVPDQDDQNFCDYTTVEDGILLSYNAAQNYDYVLTITYDFSWMKTTGRLSKVNSKEASNSFYIDDYKGPVKVFVNGYDLEDPYFSEDSDSGTVVFKEDVSDLEVQALHVPKREYGYIRLLDVNNNAIIRPLRTYKTPLLFVNGQAMDPVQDQISWNNDGTVTIPGAKLDMMWSIVDLTGIVDTMDNVVFTAPMKSGTINDDCYVHYASEMIPNSSTNNAILFINGLLVKKEDLKFDRTNHVISVIGSDGKTNTLRPGQQYILIYDKYNWLYDDKQLSPALPVGTFSDSLVYINGKLICNAPAIETFALMTDTNVAGEKVTYPGVFNEIKCFKTELHDARGNYSGVSKDYRIYNYKNGTWDVFDKNEIKDLDTVVYGYENMPRSVHILIPSTTTSKKTDPIYIPPYTSEDDVEIYAFNYANKIEHALEIHTIEADADHPILTVGNNKYYDAKQKKEVAFSDPNKNKLSVAYLPNKNTLRVWCNGIRQYPATDKFDGIQESIDGKSFTLPYPFVGKITYLVELPENGQDKPCTVELLDNTNIKPGYVNMYITEQPLFPGRVTVYLNGIRLPADAFTLMDNYTLLINGDTQLIGTHNNYETEPYLCGSDKKTLHHTEKVIENIGGKEQVTDTYEWPDRLLVEVRQDERQEATLETTGHPTYEISVANRDDIDQTIIEPADELMIFVDGLYFGPSKNNGYIVNPARGTIGITDADTLSVLNTDEMMEEMTSSPDSKAYYLKRHPEPYDWRSHKLTIEWR